MAIAKFVLAARILTGIIAIYGKAGSAKALSEAAFSTVCTIVLRTGHLPDHELTGVVSDRAMFALLFSAPFAPGKYISALERLV